MRAVRRDCKRQVSERVPLLDSILPSAQAHWRRLNDFVKKGGWWVIAQNALMLAALILAPWRHGEPWPWACRGAGAILLALGAATGYLGARALGRNLTPYPRPRTDAQLVTSGVYTRLRHPLYACLMFSTGGWALLWSSAWAGGLALLLAGLLDLKARREEKWLQNKFPGYGAYAARSHRFLPGIY